MPINTSAQQYHLFPEKDACWTIQNAIYEGNPPQTWTSLYFIETDTFLLNKFYKNVYEYYLNPTTFDTIRSLYASIRQDTLGKQVFIIRHYFSESSERKLLDFDIYVGDTVLLDAYFWELNPQGSDSIFIVDSISDIILSNGKISNQYYLSNHDNNFPVSQILIEGVGSIFNPFGPVNALVNKIRKDELCCPDYLLCLTSMGENVYVYNDYSDCQKLTTWTTIENNLEELIINIFPNPVNDFLNLELNPKFGYLQLSVFDLIGNLVINEKISDRTANIDLRKIKSGQYLIRLMNSNTVKTCKIIVSH